MSNTLNYSSVARWMSLAVWAAGEYKNWEFDLQLTYTDDTYTWFFHSIAVEALDRGFSLRAGHREYAVGDLLQAIAPDDTNMYAAFIRIDRETWLTPPGARGESLKTRKGKQSHA